MKNYIKAMLVFLVLSGTPVCAEDIVLPEDSPLRKMINEIFPAGKIEPSGYWTKLAAPELVEAG
jgi:hypothetical protein